MATNPSPSEGDLAYSLILSSLVLTPDAGLEELRRRRAGSEDLSIDRLRRAREHLRRIARAVAEPSAGAWEAIEAAFDALDAPRPRSPAQTPPSFPPAPEPAIVTVSNPPLPVPPVAVSTPPRDSPWAALAPPAAVTPVVGGTPPAAPAANDAKKNARIDVDETAIVPIIDDLGEPLPFVSEPGRPPPAPAAPTEDRSGTTMAFRRVDMNVDGTLPVVVLAREEGAGSDPGSMTLDQYAALCAALSLTSADDHSDITRRYGLQTAADRQRLDETWHRAMEADSALRSAWQERYDAHRKRLSRGT